MIRLIMIGVVIICIPLIVIAQGGGAVEAKAAPGPNVPERGSAERKAIVDALRVPVEKMVKQPVIFKIDHLKTQNNFAFLLGKPERPDGTALDYSGTGYQEAVDAGAFDDGIVALLRKVNGKWKVIQYVIGATDVPYVEWDKKYGAPKGIFPQ